MRATEAIQLGRRERIHGRVVRVKIQAMRRIQAASLIVALLAAPLALVARGYACAPQECTMACCRGRHGMKMDCSHSAPGMAMCMMCHNSQATPDYGLAAPIAPFQLAAAAKLPRPEVRRTASVKDAAADSAGYSLPPFQPPRA